MKKLLKKKNVIPFIVGILFSVLIFIAITIFPVNKCNISEIKMYGDLASYIPSHTEDDTTYDDFFSSEDIATQLRNAENDTKIKGILINVDSTGGSPVGAEEIANTIKEISKPVVVSVRGSADSGAYWSISSANRIFAFENSDVGGIGVTSSYLNEVKKNEQEGYEYERLVSGKFKDMGVTSKRLTNEEKELIMRDVKIVFNNFINTISINRNIPIEEVSKFADGSTMLGPQALKLGLIDEIGSGNDALNYLGTLIGENTSICYQ